MKTKPIRVDKKTLAVMRKFLPQRRNETMPEYVSRYVEEMQEAERRENFSN
jgi:hypothetical protein